MKKLMLICFCIMTSFSFAQPAQNWTDKEKAYYNSLTGFCNYIESAPAGTLNKDTLFNKYFLFDYVLKDSSKGRIKERLLKFDELLSSFIHYLDSVGLVNLDAKPVRFYRDNKTFYKPFTDELKEYASNTFAYYNKTDPDHPLGYLWFDEHSFKLISWILIDQGGTHYFLTFDLM